MSPQTNPHSGKPSNKIHPGLVAYYVLWLALSASLGLQCLALIDFGYYVDEDAFTALILGNFVFVMPILLIIFVYLTVSRPNRWNKIGLGLIIFNALLFGVHEIVTNIFW